MSLMSLMMLTMVMIMLIDHDEDEDDNDDNDDYDDNGKPDLNKISKPDFDFLNSQFSMSYFDFSFSILNARF